MEEQWAAGLARRMISGDRDAFDELMKQFYPDFCGRLIS